MSDPYWIIDYHIRLLSDFHAGAGSTLLGGNLHGVRLDAHGFPYLPPTQVRGLLRLGGYGLKKGRPSFQALYQRNFPGQGSSAARSWSYTRAAFPLGLVYGTQGAAGEGMLLEQSHVCLEEGMVQHLFSYQKAGALSEEWMLQGRIYAVEPAAETDVAFLLACMRYEDRLGHRRSRGYGKAAWTLQRIRKYLPGSEPEEIIRNLPDWLNLLFTED